MLAAVERKAVAAGTAMAVGTAAGTAVVAADVGARERRRPLGYLLGRLDLACLAGGRIRWRQRMTHRHGLSRQ